MNTENIILSALIGLERGFTYYLLSLCTVKAHNKYTRLKNNEHNNNSTEKMSEENDLYKKVEEKFRKLMEVVVLK